MKLILIIAELVKILNYIIAKLSIRKQIWKFLILKRKLSNFYKNISWEIKYKTHQKLYFKTYIINPNCIHIVSNMKQGVNNKKFQHIIIYTIKEQIIIIQIMIYG